MRAFRLVAFTRAENRSLRSFEERVNVAYIDYDRLLLVAGVQ